MNGSLFSEPKYMNGVGFGDVGPPVPNEPLVTPKVTIDALSQFDAIYLRNKFHFLRFMGV